MTSTSRQEWERRAPASGGNLDSTYGVVLAGGRGTRLKQLTDACAKPAVPFAGKLKIIDFTLGNCVNSGIRRVSVLTQYKGHGLKHHVEHAWAASYRRASEFINVVPPRRQHGDNCGYRGTADAVYQNLQMLRQAGAQYVLVLAGDHVYKMDYNRIVDEHVKRAAEVTVACIEVPLAKASSFGVVGIDDKDGRIRVFDEKPKNPCPMPNRPGVALASMGIYVFNAVLLYEALERDALDEDSDHDFGRNIIPGLIAHARVFAHDFFHSCVGSTESQPYWRDVGTLDAYWQAHMDLLRPMPELDLFDGDWPIRSRQHQLVPNKLKFNAAGCFGFESGSYFSSDSLVDGVKVKRSLLFSKVSVGKGSVIENTLLLPGVVVGRNAVVRRAIVDSDCVLPDDIEIGVDHELDRMRFTVSENGVTLVTASMLVPIAPPQVLVIHQALFI